MLTRIVPLVVLVGVMAWRASVGGVDVRSIGIVAAIVVLVILPLVALGVTSRLQAGARRIRVAVRGASVIPGYSTPELSEYAAANGLQLPGATSGNAVVALVARRGGLEFWAPAGPTQIVVVPWRQIVDISVGRTLVGFRPTPTLQVTHESGGILAMIPADGAGLGALISTTASARRVVERVAGAWRRALAATDA